MGISHLLEDFGNLRGEQTRVIGDSALEDVRLEAYEAGYKAGWDDAVSAQDTDARRVSSDFASNLSNLSFTCEDAYQTMLRGLRPVLDTAVAKILPRVAAASLTPRVSELLHDALATGTRPSMELHVAPENIPSLEGLLDGFDTVPVTIVPAQTLGPGQVQISVGTSEHEIDLDHVLTEINRAVDAFFDAIPESEQKETVA